EEGKPDVVHPATRRATQPPLPGTAHPTANQAMRIEPAPLSGAPLPLAPTAPPTTQPVATIAGASAPGPPIPVTVVPPERTPWDRLKEYAGKLAGPLGTAGIVAIFVVFMLLSRED